MSSFGVDDAVGLLSGRIGHPDQALGALGIGYGWGRAGQLNATTEHPSLLGIAAFRDFAAIDIAATQASQQAAAEAFAKGTAAGLPPGQVEAMVDRAVQNVQNQAFALKGAVVGYYGFTAGNAALDATQKGISELEEGLVQLAEDILLGLGRCQFRRPERL